MVVGLSNGRIMVYDIRDMQLAQELEGPVLAPVSHLSFSNKGIFLAVAWEGHDTCRVYSLHKGFVFAELRQEGLAVTALAFDFYGGFLAVGTSENLFISSYKNWKKVLTILRPSEAGPVHVISWNASGRRIYVANRAQGNIKTLSLH